jgi:hypothetical protein
VRLLVSMLVALSLLAGCGGDDDAADTTGGDANQLLDETFANSEDIKSGKVELDLRVEGADDVTVKLSGPFQSEGDGKLPRLDLDASLEGGGQSFEAGITSTGEQGFVSFQGTEYEVSGPVFQQIQAGYEQAQKDAQQQGGGTSLATLGVDPRKWLTDVQNEGDSEVGGTETIKITGGVDVEKLLDDVNVALERTRSLGLQGSEDLPEQLTDEQKRQAAEAIKDVSVEVETGKDDHILRRIAVSGEAATDDTGTVSLQFDLKLLDVNEDQEIDAPENARPFEELLQGLEGLGISGLGGASGSGSGSGGGGGGGATTESLEEYSQCVQDAGSDTDKLRECGELLTP